jgi:hypothetical protein
MCNIDLCQYKDIFGKPMTGAHSYRLFDIAIVDAGLSFCLVLALWKYSGYDFMVCLLVVLALGIIFHRTFCVRTKLDTILFSD